MVAIPLPQASGARSFSMQPRPLTQPRVQPMRRVAVAPTRSTRPLLCSASSQLQPGRAMAPRCVASTLQACLWPCMRARQRSRGCSVYTRAALLLCQAALDASEPSQPALHGMHACPRTQAHALSFLLAGVRFWAAVQPVLCAPALQHAPAAAPAAPSACTLHQWHQARRCDPAAWRFGRQHAAGATPSLSLQPW